MGDVQFAPSPNRHDQTFFGENDLTHALPHHWRVGRDLDLLKGHLVQFAQAQGLDPVLVMARLTMVWL